MSRLGWCERCRCPALGVREMRLDGQVMARLCPVHEHAVMRAVGIQLEREGKAAEARDGYLRYCADAAFTPRPWWST